MAAGLAVVMLRRHLVRLIKRLKLRLFYLLRLAALLLLIEFLLAVAVQLEQVMLIEVLLVHQLVGKRLRPELTAMHFLGLADYGHAYSSYLVLGVIGKNY